MRNVSFPVFMRPTGPMMRHAGVLASRSRQVAHGTAYGGRRLFRISPLAAFDEDVVRQRKLWRTRPTCRRIRDRTWASVRRFHQSGASFATSCCIGPRLIQYELRWHPLRRQEVDIKSEFTAIIGFPEKRPRRHEDTKARRKKIRIGEDFLREPPYFFGCVLFQLKRCTAVPVD